MDDVCIENHPESCGAFVPLNNQKPLMTGFLSSFWRWLTPLLSLLASGCASVPDADRDPQDPWEPLNRALFRLNDDIDGAFVRPLSRAYKTVVPQPLDRGITNFFANIQDINSAANNLLQFKLHHTVRNLERFVVNTTVGVLGFMDVASNLDIMSYREDFGQTLGRWGVAPGPYLMLPLLGPSSVRDSIGMGVDFYALNPIVWATDNHVLLWGLNGLWYLDYRADSQNAVNIFENAALDRYRFVRDAYFQKRRHVVSDGEQDFHESAL
ncbi:phospholipid-binding lipoprotein MlaA [Gammaproteobacteria bacterium]